jgi:hypothetical protein
MTIELGAVVSLAPEEPRGRVFVEMPTSGVDLAPPRIYGSEVRGGQTLAAIVAVETNGVVWDRAAAQAQAEEEAHLMQLQVTALVEQYYPAPALADVPPPRTVETAFAGSGVLGGRAYGNGCIIYSYAVFVDYLGGLDPPVIWPAGNALIIKSSTGTLVCRASQLLVKGYSAADYRLVLNITGWDLQANLDLPECMIVVNPVFPLSPELLAIAVRDEGEDAWRNTQTGRIIDTSLNGEYLLLRDSGELARRLVARTAGC